MKNSRVWVLAALSLAGLALSGSHVFAGLFDCFCKGHCGHCYTQITCRPYNAFTPICWGNLTCDGCCPNPNMLCGGGGGCFQGCGMTPTFSGFCGGGDCGYGACLPSAVPTTPTAAPVAPGSPLPNVSQMNPYYNPLALAYYGYGYGVQPTGWYNPYQGYYPGYNYQAAYNPQLMNMMAQPAAYYPGYYGYPQQQR